MTEPRKPPLSFFIIYATFTALPFGLWQGSFASGLFCFFVAFAALGTADDIEQAIKGRN